MNMELSLLDILAVRMACVNLSDLRFLSDWEQARLSRIVEAIPACTATPRDWNDTLCYLTGEQPQSTQEDARNRLILFLRQSRTEAC